MTRGNSMEYAPLAQWLQLTFQTTARYDLCNPLTASRHADATCLNITVVASSSPRVERAKSGMLPLINQPSRR